MKSTVCFLLIFLFILHLMITVNSKPSEDSLADKKILEAPEGRRFHREPKKIECYSVTVSGRWASCPAGSATTGCACGYGCGSWDIQNGNTCHCQCAIMDWTTARCCKLA